MKETNPIFSIKNFRSFGEEGADFELAPITILTGCNSAGKSSLVKALMLLTWKNGDPKGVSSDFKVSSKKLGFGGFTSVAHENREITFSYKVMSNFLLEEVVVRKTYVRRKGDLVDDGELSSFTIERIDGTIIYQIGPWDEEEYGVVKRNYEAVKDNFDRFYMICKYNIAHIEHESYLFSLKRKEHEVFDAQPKKELEYNKLKAQLESLGLTEKDGFLLWEEYCDVWESIEAIEKSINEENARMKYKKRSEDEIENERERNNNKLISPFFDKVVESLASPLFLNDIDYVDSASAIVARLYSTEEDNKMCNALRDFNARTVVFNDFYYKHYEHYEQVHKPGSLVDKWIKQFNIGDGMKIKGTEEGLGLMAYILRGNKKRLLADEGYGITQFVSLLLRIDNCIPSCLEKDIQYFDNNPIDLGHYPLKTICVEEPEVHLHPKYQSMLAEMFVEAYQKYNIHFIIETHSEYLIRKLQVMVADKENELTANDVSLNYVEKDANGVSTNRQINILGDGRLSEPFGPGFLDEADSLAYEILKLKTRKK